MESWSRGASSIVLAAEEAVHTSRQNATGRCCVGSYDDELHGLYSAVYTVGLASSNLEIAEG